MIVNSPPKLASSGDIIFPPEAMVTVHERNVIHQRRRHKKPKSFPKPEVNESHREPRRMKTTAVPYLLSEQIAATEKLLLLR